MRSAAVSKDQYIVLSSWIWASNSSHCLNLSSRRRMLLQISSRALSAGGCGCGGGGGGSSPRPVVTFLSDETSRCCIIIFLRILWWCSFISVVTGWRGTSDNRGESGRVVGICLLPSKAKEGEDSIFWAKLGWTMKNEISFFFCCYANRTNNEVI